MRYFLNSLAIFVMIAIFLCPLARAQEYMLVCSQEAFFPAQYQDLKKQLALADSLIAENEQKEAIAIYEQIIKKHPQHLHSWQQLAKLYSWNEMPDSAIKAYEKVVELNPVDLDAKKRLAQFYLWNDRQQDAIGLYEEILSLDSQNLEIHRKLAQLYSWNSMPQNAIEEYEQIVKLDSMDTGTMKMLADHYFWMDRAEDGIRMLKKIVELEPDSLQYRKKLAQALIWNDQPQQAIEQYEKILQMEPNDTLTLKSLAQQYLWNNQPQKAAPLWQKLMEMFPDSINFKMNLANSYLWSNQSSKARKPLLEILQQQPLNKDVLLSLAEIERWSGKWDIAKKRLEKVKYIDPHNERMLKLLKEIRQNYGTFVLAKYTRLSDSNLITRETFPLSAACFYNHFWDFNYQAAQYRVTDSKVDSALIGYGMLVSANFHPFPNTTITLGLGAIDYSSNWTPWQAKLQLTRTWRGKLTTKLSFERQETQEGVRALTEKIVLQGLSAEMYWQILTKLALAGNYQLFKYSDDNQKLTLTGATYWTIHQNRPNVYLYSYYLYENFEKIYLSSLPYWTPDQLVTKSIGFAMKHPFFKFMSLELGYGLTRQQGINSNNYNANLVLSFTDFDKLVFSYQKLGSKIYHSEYLTISFGHRF